MKKSLFTVAFLATAVFISAQNAPLMHVDQSALVYVGKGALVFNGGGLQTKNGSGSVTPGIIENHGNFMVVGAAGDVYRNLDSSGNAITTNNIGGNFINKLNEEAAYQLRNSITSTVAPVYTYGQLYISGLSQSNITGVVNQEFRSVNHGAFQQIGIPFWNKDYTTLSELGKSFNLTRFSENEITVWNNATTVFDNLPSATIGTSARPAYSYYILGAGGSSSPWRTNGLATTRTLVGTPVTDVDNYQVTLSGAGSTVNYGAGGNAINQYTEKYNSYLGDFFAYSRNNIWDGVDFGKNLYFFGNPYLTNLDLNNLKTTGDQDFINNLYGIRFEPTPGGVIYQQGVGGNMTGFKYVTKAVDGSGNVIWTGDQDYLVVRPMGTFVIKLNNNLAAPAPTINFANLRRFNYYPRASGTAYSPNANKVVNGTTTGGTVKQLAVVGLDANGNELARTYYVLSPNSITGYSPNAVTQVANSSTYDLGTYEENPISGGYDPNYVNRYWLYINEAKDDFVGKSVKMVKYTADIKNFKFIIKENGVEINDGVHNLSSGIGFYFKGPNGAVTSLNQNQILPATGNVEQEYDLYYGQPNTGTLGTVEDTVASRTVIVYNPTIDDYIVRFDKNWKKANIQVFDMSGKLILSEANVDATSDFTIQLEKNIKAVYLVKVTSDKGTVVQSKITK